jgi:cobalt-zinc-cadmium efflux system protein
MAHAHPHARAGDTRRMAIALAINLAMLAGGVAGYVLFDSLALGAEAGHVLTDVAAIALGIFAARMAARPARGKRTFGYGRTEILAALVNGATLVAIAVLVAVDAISRLSDPPAVEGLGVLVFGLFELVGNAAATLVLARGDRDNLNLQGVLRHSAADALGALQVVAAGAIVLATGWYIADPIASLLIAVLILAGSWKLIRDPIEVLMESAPPGVDVQAVGQAMAAVPGVREVHDLHVWSVTSGFPALAAHVLVSADDDVDEVRERIEVVVRERFGIDHTTLQTMVQPLLELEDRRPRR